MILISEKDQQRMPWKNGGGSTTEIAIFPAGSDLEGFDWRISMAHVETAGPFSIFPGIDRTIVILEGSGLALDIEGEGSVTLTPGAAPYAFKADVPTFGTPLDGALTDLNVMTRRGKYRSSVARLIGDLRMSLECRGAASLILARRDCRLLDETGERLAMPAGAAARLENISARRLTIFAEREIEVFLVELFRC